MLRHEPEQPTIPYNFSFGSALIYEGCIFLLGGVNSKTDVYKWDDRQTEWTSWWSLPYDFYRGAAVVYDGSINILGGEGGETYHYGRSHHGSWISKSTLPYNFSDGSAVVYNGKIHILGGHFGDNTTTSRYHYSWDGTEWVQESTLPYDFYNGYAVIYDDEIHILGGSRSNTETNHYSWDGTSWAAVSTLPISVHGGALVADGHIRIMGGRYGSTTRKQYYWGGSGWIELPDLPYDFDSGIAIEYGNNNHYVFSFCETGSAYVSPTGVCGFNMYDDPYFDNPCSWYLGGYSDDNTIRYASENAIVYGNDIYLINADTISDTFAIWIRKLSAYSYNYSTRSVTFSVVDPDVLGTIESNQIVNDNSIIYSYGGVIDRDVDEGYLYKYVDNGRYKYWTRINYTTELSYAFVTVQLNEYNRSNASWKPYNISLIHNGKLVIFSQDSSHLLTDDRYYKLVYDPDINKLKTYLISDNYGYYVYGKWCYGAISYDDSIYILGGFYTTNNSTYPYYMYKLNDNNTWEKTNFVLPFKTSGACLDVFGYALLKHKLHIVYTKDGITSHMSYDLLTKESKVENTSPPSSFCGVCSSNSDFVFIVGHSDNKYKLYYLEDESKWTMIDDDLGVNNLKRMCFVYNTAYPSSEKMELFTEKDGIVSQYDANSEQYFR